mmetsp:Transcript_21150/g.47667  ORF Transcript_21150/g.47667 Transcript_21150/m.47667 type:complete len:332 (-) Transcript_21150:1958-2953(-)
MARSWTASRLALCSNVAWSNEASGASDKPECIKGTEMEWGMSNSSGARLLGLPAPLLTLSSLFNCATSASVASPGSVSSCSGSTGAAVVSGPSGSSNKAPPVSTIPAPAQSASMLAGNCGTSSGGGGGRASAGGGRGGGSTSSVWHSASARETWSGTQHPSPTSHLEQYKVSVSPSASRAVITMASSCTHVTPSQRHHPVPMLCGMVPWWGCWWWTNPDAQEFASFSRGPKSTQTPPDPDASHRSPVTLRHTGHPFTISPATTRYSPELPVPLGQCTNNRAGCPAGRTTISRSSTHSPDSEALVQLPVISSGSLPTCASGWHIDARVQANR